MTFRELFTIGRNRRALTASVILMFLQQFVGVNVTAYYSSTILKQHAGYSKQAALLIIAASMLWLAVRFTSPMQPACMLAFFSQSDCKREKHKDALQCTCCRPARKQFKPWAACRGSPHSLQNLSDLQAPAGLTLYESDCICFVALSRHV